MGTKRVIAAAAVSMLMLVGTGFAAASEGSEAVMRSGNAPGEGVICAMGIYSAMEEVGKRCLAKSDRNYQRELSRSVRRIDQYVLRNSDWKLADLARFKREQSEVGSPLEKLCRRDLLEMYEHLSKQGARKLRQSMNEMLSKPGKPTWGTCL